MSLTKNPMKPMVMKPMLVALKILRNSVWGMWGNASESATKNATVGRRSLTLAVRLGAALDEVDAVLREQLERLDHERVDITHSRRLPG